MSRFFTDRPRDGKIYINGEDAKHLSKSLRMEIGDEVTACDPDGNDYLCKITEINAKEVTLEVITKTQNKAEPTVKVTLYMAVPKSDKMDLICQKCTELGIYKIVPFLSSRVISRPDEKSFEKKQIRWNKICMEASKQSGRGIIPEVSGLYDFKTAMQEASDADLALFFYENEQENSLKALLDSKKYSEISIVVGPEGGFEELEVQKAKELGLLVASLGNRILRCETAPISAISAIMFHSDNL